MRQLLLKIEERIDDFCEINETDEQVTVAFFSLSHTDLFEEILRSEHSHSDFWIANSWCSDSSVRENENIETKEHWFDSFFIDSDINLNASVERFEFFDEVISKAFWLREVVDEICEACRANASMIADFFSISHIDLIVSIERNEQNSEDFWTKISWCSDSNVWEDDDFDEVNEHWIDVFFIDFDTVSDALDERCKIFDEMIVSKIIVDSNICFDVAIEISNSCEIDETDESSKVSFFSFSHSDLSVLIERDELLMSFFACCSRTCSRSFFFELKLKSQRMQIIFEVLIFANETFAKSTRKISIHSFSDVDFMIVCLSNQISKTKSQRHDDNRKSKSDFLYWCWHCWRCCKKFAISLNRRLSYVNVESKISIFWNFDVDFAASWVFKVFDLTRFAFLTALILIFLIAFRFSDEMFNFCCFCEADEIDEAINVKTIEVSKISHACSSRNCKTNSYVCWFRATHEEYWRRCEFQIS